MKSTNDISDGLEGNIGISGSRLCRSFAEKAAIVFQVRARTHVHNFSLSLSPREAQAGVSLGCMEFLKLYLTVELKASSPSTSSLSPSALSRELHILLPDGKNTQQHLRGVARVGVSSALRGRSKMESRSFVRSFSRSWKIDPCGKARRRGKGEFASAYCHAKLNRAPCEIIVAN